jgi:hypothetical protein
MLADENGSTIQAGRGFLWKSAAIFGGTSPDAGNFLENIREIAHIRLLNPFLMLRCTA